MTEYDVLRTRHSEQADSLAPQHQERILWTPEQLELERERGLRALIGVAKERSSWQSARLKHIEGDNITEADLPSIPPMTKHDLMENMDGILTDARLTRARVESHLEELNDDKYLLDEFHVVASGGSSGTRGVFVYDWDGWLQTRLMLLRFSIRHQRVHGDPSVKPVVAFVSAGKATHMTFAMTRTFGAGSGTVSVPATLPLPEIVARLNELQPTVLGGYPTMLYPLAGEAKAGRLRISPTTIRPGSEPLLPEMRAAIADAWGCPIINIYGTSEGVSASSCGESRGMHLNEDQAIFELVDADGHPVAAGQRAAKMYITNLFNKAMPLIPYEMTDETALIDEPCPCGSSMRRIDDIQGRTDDVFVYDGGVVVHPLTFRSRLGREPNIIEYQVTQSASGASIAIRTHEAVDVSAIQRDLESDLRRAGIAQPSVSVEIVDAFERQQTGKLKRFIPLG